MTVQTEPAQIDPSVAPALAAPADLPLAQAAIASLTAAAAARAEEGAANDERAVFRPDSWLLQCCWQSLADGGMFEGAMRVARLSAARQPLAPMHCLHRLSRQIDKQWGLAHAIAAELKASQAALFAPAAGEGTAQEAERLLYAAAAAANIGERQLAFACLERLDQFTKPWDRIMVQPDQRGMLAETVLRLGPHPLTLGLMAHALRRFGDAGAHFVLDICAGAAERLRRSTAAPKMARLLNLGVDTFRNASLTSLHSRRLTAAVFGYAGLVDEVLAQLTTIANIQAARREGGLSLRQGDPTLLRQVKRPTADADIDFQVYALREAIRGLPLRQLGRDARLELANRLALLGNRSDGWTAAGAATTLVELGAIKYAIEVVGKIPDTDPTRSEGVISLVRALLAAGEAELAEEQAQKGLAWARAYPGRNPERALTWGLAEVYLERRQSDRALALLDGWEPQSVSLLQRMRGVFGRKLDDDELRNGGLRLAALLQRERTGAADIGRLTTQLLEAAPQLLDGEALVSFLLDDLLASLLASGRTKLALSVLPALSAALRSGLGEKHAMRVANVANVLVTELAPAQPERLDPARDGKAAAAALEPETRQALEQFLIDLWQKNTARGLWQTVHGIHGSLPLVLLLEGPQSVEAVANYAAAAGGQWS